MDDLPSTRDRTSSAPGATLLSPAFLDTLQACRNEVTLVAAVIAAMAPLSVSSFVFMFLRRDEQRESYRYLIGCDPRWCQRYNEQHWYNNDPFIAHAITSVEILTGSAVLAHSAAQHAMLTEAAEYGFRSGMVIPAHGPGDARIGVLYVGSSLPAERIEPVLWANRAVLRELAFTLYDWWALKLAYDARNKIGIDAAELAILRCKVQGLTHRETAQVLDFSASKVDARLRALYRKLNVHSQMEAIACAERLDLLHSGI